MRFASVCFFRLSNKAEKKAVQYLQGRFASGKEIGMEENNNTPTPQENENAQIAPICETDKQENLPEIEVELPALTLTTAVDNVAPGSFDGAGIVNKIESVLLESTAVP